MSGLLPWARKAGGMGGGLSPGHSTRNAVGRLEGIQWANNLSPYQKYAMGFANARGGAPQNMRRPQRAMGRGQNPLLGMLDRLVGRAGGRGKAGGGAAGGGGGGQGALDQIGNNIGPHMQSPPVQEFLPEWLTQQTMNDIEAQAHQRVNPVQLVAQKTGARGVGSTSGSVLSSAARANAAGLNEAARIGSETGLQDHLERSRFDIRHALARHQDVTQGARNQALRDQIAMRGQHNDFNQLLAMIGLLT